MALSGRGLLSASRGALPLELAVLVEAARGKAAGLGALADPVLPVVGGLLTAAAVDPAEAVGLAEGLDVDQTAIAEGLDLHALAARHLGQLVGLEDDELAVLADRGGEIAFDLH